MPKLFSNEPGTPANRAPFFGRRMRRTALAGLMSAAVAAESLPAQAQTGLPAPAPVITRRTPDATDGQLWRVRTIGHFNFAPDRATAFDERHIAEAAEIVWQQMAPSEVPSGIEHEDFIAAYIAAATAQRATPGADSFIAPGTTVYGMGYRRRLPTQGAEEEPRGVATARGLLADEVMYTGAENLDTEELRVRIGVENDTNGDGDPDTITTHTFIVAYPDDAPQDCFNPTLVRIESQTQAVAAIQTFTESAPAAAEEGMCSARVEVNFFGNRRNRCFAIGAGVALLIIGLASRGGRDRTPPHRGERRAGQDNTTTGPSDSYDD